MVPVAVALGSNLGDREQSLRGAAAELGSFVEALRVSSFLETDPEGAPDQPRFLNAAAVGRTSVAARDFLARLMAVERRFGRTRPYPGAARTLDLDLILYGDLVSNEPGLTVPHPRFRERAFVLVPLAEIAGEWRDPVSGQTIARLLAALRSADTRRSG